MREWSHDLPGSDSWVSLIFGELREKPEEDDTATPYGRTDMNGSSTLQRLRRF
jgi:hypothetical protein